MTPDLIVDSRTEDAKNMARILYFAHGITFVFSLGLLSILPLIVNYIKRDDAQGTIAHSHHTWMIRSFWFYVLWMVVGGILLLTLGFILIGIPLAWGVWLLAWVWKAYRLIKGFIDLNNNRAMPV